MKSQEHANPRQPVVCTGELRLDRVRATTQWPAAMLALFTAAGCGGSGGTPSDPDAGIGPDAAVTDGGGTDDGNRPVGPDAGPPDGFAFPELVTANDGASLNWFGYSVAADNNVIVVGAPFYDRVSGGQITDPSIGAAYMFELIGDTWMQTAQLLSSATGETKISGMFGWSVAIDDNLIAVGAWNETVGSQIGAVYVFERIGGAWTPAGKIVPLAGDDQERFGHSVSVSGTRIAIGAPFVTDSDDNEAPKPSYVFERSGATWIGTRLLPEGDARDSWFGYSIDISGDTVVVGAPGYEVPGLGAGLGAAYVFELDGGNWRQKAHVLDGDGQAQDFMGRDVAIDGEVIVVGSEAGGNPTSLNTGMALVYERASGTWSETTRLIPSSAAVASEIGYAVDVHGNTIVVGTHRDDVFGTDSGAAYVFEKGATGWTEKSKIYNPSGRAGDHFGASVVANGDSILVGARFDDDDGTDSGSLYVFAATTP